MPINSLYVHFPFCRHLCNYCDFYKKIPENRGEVEKFQSLLQGQFSELKNIFQKEGEHLGPLDTLYFGGGTPSLWGLAGAEFFREFMQSNQLVLNEGAEWTMEVNPGTWTSESLAAWQKLGVNRFSLGVQSLDSRFLKLLDRVHNIDDVYETLEEFKRRGEDFSVDFMLGLPDSQNLKRDIRSELDEILKYQPTHLSLYILTTKSHYIHAARLPEEEWIAEEYLTVAHYLKERGFEHYEVSNFAKPGKFSRHNMAYWKCESVAAIGPSATGYLASSNKRYKWGVSEKKISWEELNAEQVELEEIYMGLRSQQGLKLSKIREILPKESKKALDELRQRWQEQSFIENPSKDLIRATSEGYLILDTLMDDLFRIM